MDGGRGLQSHFFTFKITLESVKKQAVMGNRKPAARLRERMNDLTHEENTPVKNFLLLLRSNALVFKQQIKEGRLIAN
jgi:hypothetical protein